MHKVKKIMTKYIENDNIDGAISEIFNSEDEIKEEIKKFKQDPKNYAFKHVDFFYEYADLAPFATLGTLIFFVIKNDKLTFLEYLLLDKRTIEIETKFESCPTLSDYITNNFSINNSFYAFFKQEDINKYVQKHNPELYEICSEKTRFMKSIINF